MATKAPEVVGLGFCSYDRIFTVDAFPPQGGKTRILGEEHHGGGQVSTAMVALARLGARVRFIGRRGDDAEGELIETEMRAAGVDLTGLITVTGANSQQAYIFVPAAGGERSIFWRREPAIDLTADDLDPDWIPSEPHVLLIDGHEMDACLAAARLSQERGGRVVLDAEYVEARTAELIGLVDYLVADEGFCARLLGPEHAGSPPSREALERLRRLGPRRVVVTLGELGAVSWDGSDLLEVPAFDLPVVDTTGAGDAFHAGYCFGLLREMDEAARLRFACALAGLKCRALGGRAGLPDLTEIEALLATGRVRLSD